MATHGGISKFLIFIEFLLFWDFSNDFSTRLPLTPCSENSRTPEVVWGLRQRLLPLQRQQGVLRLFWLPRNPQFRDLSQRGIQGPDVFTTLRVTGDVTLNSDVMQLVIPNDVIQTTINSAMSKSTIDSTVYPNTYRCRDREYTVLYDVTRTRIDRFFQSLTIIHLILV